MAVNPKDFQLQGRKIDRTGRTGQVQDRIQGTVDRHGPDDVRFQKFKPGRVQHRTQIAFQIACQEGVHSEDMPAVVQQACNQVAAHESGRSANEGSHVTAPGLSIAVTVPVSMRLSACN